MLQKLDNAFFYRDATAVAPDLIGATFVIHQQKVKIIETEAYLGHEDPASHAFRGPTPRASIMFGPVGCLYVYLIYGMHHCLNIVCHTEAKAGAVLIRGIQTEHGIISGPGKLCRYLNINKTYNHLNLTENANIFCLQSEDKPKIITTPRIGIKQAQDKLWRFVAKIS